MRPLRYSINVTLDGCCDHRVITADEEMHRHHAENLAKADALLLGRVTYEMMEAASIGSVVRRVASDVPIRGSGPTIRSSGRRFGAAQLPLVRKGRGA